MRRELRFAFKLEHYDDDSGVQSSNAQRVQPRGRELLQLIEHKAALISRSDVWFDVLPVETTSRGAQADAQLAEAAKSALRWEVYHAEKGYQDVRDRVVLGALGARMWGAAADFHPKVGPFGEILFRAIAGWDMAWAPGFTSPHDPACPWFYERLALPIEEVEAMDGWEDTKDLAADNVADFDEEESGDRRLRLIREAAAKEAPRDGLVRVVKLYERFVWDKQRSSAAEGTRVLEPGDRRMMCLACGFRGPTQDQLGEELPVAKAAACPECGEDLERQDAEESVIESLRFRGGKKLTIFAPLQRRRFRVSSWPHELTRLPYMVWQGKPSPFEQIGQSETTTNWTMQVSSNVALRLGLEHMRLARPITFYPRRGVEDARGQPWQGDEAQGLMGFYTHEMDQRGPISVQGAGLPPAWNTLFQAIQNVFRANMGSTDLGLTPNQSKDIAVGTIRQIIESGELPVDHQIERLRRAEAPFFRAVYELIRSTYSPARTRRMDNGDGTWTMLSILGSDLPDYDIQIVASPSLVRLNQGELQTLMEFAAAPPYMRRFLARRLNVSPTEVAELETEEKRVAAESPEIAAGGAAANGRNGSALPVGVQRRLGGATHGAIGVGP